MPKIVDKDAMRVRIIGAAMAVFQRAGFHGARMIDIADEAGLAKGTLYLYFQNKHDLTAALVGAYFTALENAFLEAEAPRTLDEFIEGIAGSLDIDDSYADVLRMFLETLSPGFADDTVRLQAAGVFDRIAGKFATDLAALQKAGEVRRSATPEALARALTAMLDGMLLHRGLFAIPPERYDDMIFEICGLIRAGLRR